MSDLFQQMAEITQRLNRLLHEAGCIDWQFEQAEIRMPARAFDRMMANADKVALTPKRDATTTYDHARINAIKVHRAHDPRSLPKGD